MNVALQTHVKTVSTPAFVSTPVQNGLLQRKCSRCGTFGQDDERKDELKKRLGLQTKLIVNEPGDIYEREADRIADQVMATPAHPGVTGSPPRIQRFSGQANGQMDTAPTSVDLVLASSGMPLEPVLRQDMEQRFGHDFSRVRVHSGTAEEQTAREIGAYAYTAGNDIIFGKDQFVPGTNYGRKLLLHELTHVVQQSGSNPSGAVNMVFRKPAAFQASLNPASLSFSQLEAEINEIQQHLDANPVSNEENDRLMNELNGLRKELTKRPKQEGDSNRKKIKVNTSTKPRSLTESLRIDETMTDAELYTEIDAIHNSLASGLNKRDRANLKSVLEQLEAEKNRRTDKVADQARAEKIQQAFVPKMTGTDGAALIEVMGIVDSIRPSQTASGLYTLMRNGELLIITREEYDKIRGASQKILEERLRRVRQKADDAQNQYNSQKAINDDQWFVSGTVHFFGGIHDPGFSIAQNARGAKINANTAQVFIARGQLSRGAEFFSTSEKYAISAKMMSQAYVNNLISTSETTVTVLEITRDAAFATTLAIGAVIAAPVVAAGVSGLGVSGAGATVLTALGTGTVVGGEGALLRGGSAAGGVALAGGSTDQLLGAAKSEGWRGAKEGFSTGFGGSVARSAGAALKVGQSSSRVVNIVRGSVAQGLGNAAGSGAGTALEGGSAADVLKSSAIGFGVGTLTGPLSEGSGLIKNPVLSAAARTGTGMIAGGGQAYLETGDKNAAFRAAAIGGTSALLGGLRQPNKGPTPAQVKAFKAGRAVRSGIDSTARNVRNAAAAVMLGVSDAIPITRGTGAEAGYVIGKPVPGIIAITQETSGPSISEPLKPKTPAPESPASGPVSKALPTQRPTARIATAEGIGDEFHNEYQPEAPAPSVQTGRVERSGSTIKYGSATPTPAQLNVPGFAARSTNEDIASVFSDITEGTGSLSPSDSDVIDIPNPNQAAEIAEDTSSSRLSTREIWEPPEGAPTRPPLDAAFKTRLNWLRGRLKMHVDQAKERYIREGLTSPQEAALLDTPGLERAFRGSRIDQFAKESILQDPELAEIITAPDFINEPDILDTVFPTWFDMTTRAQWTAHIRTYGRRYGARRGYHLPTD